MVSYSASPQKYFVSINMGSDTFYGDFTLEFSRVNTTSIFNYCYFNLDPWLLRVIKITGDPQITLTAQIRQ